MIAFIIIGLLIAFIATGAVAHKMRPTPLGSTEVPVLPTRNLTDVSKRLYKEYMALPEESRPFPEIISILTAMDAKTSQDHLALRRHFDNNWLPSTRVQNGPVKFSWNPYRQGCNGRYCNFAEYHRLHNSIKEVAASIAEKEHAILLAANQPGLDMLNELEDALRSESKIQQQVTREISGTPEPVIRSRPNTVYYDTEGNIINFHVGSSY